jgi:hypothetical protein
MDVRLHRPSGVCDGLRNRYVPKQPAPSCEVLNSGLREWLSVELANPALAGNH